MVLGRSSIGTGENFGNQAKLYIPSTLNNDYLLWHTQLIVCAVKSWFKSRVIIFTFQVFWVKNILNQLENSRLKT